MPSDYPGDEVARAAFEVMMRRGWGVHPVPDGWGVTAPGVRNEFPLDRCVWGCWFGPDPFTALVEADEWYRENVEAKT